MKISEMKKYAAKALAYFKKASIELTDAEKSNIEVADFGLNNIDEIELELVTYINTDRVCAKEMVLFPGQTCPEHMHVETDGVMGKEETFRCRYGKVLLYVDGEGDQTHMQGKIPETSVTGFHEVVLMPGQQYTIMPGTKHWFQAGEEGAVVSEFSTHSTDETDLFTDERIIRAPRIEQD